MATAKRSRARKRARSIHENESPAFVDDIFAMAGSLANSRRAYAAAQLESLADSVRQFTDAMPNVPTVRAYATTAADSLEELAGYVTESDLNDMISDAREFTRRHPLATFGGSLAAGLLIAQLVQSRAPSSRAPHEAQRSRRIAAH
jgi:hypothetical protein